MSPSKSKSGTLPTGSAHDCTWMICQSKFSPPKQSFIKRSFRNFRMEDLIDDAREVVWDFEGVTMFDEVELNKRVDDLEKKLKV